MEPCRSILLQWTLLHGILYACTTLWSLVGLYYFMEPCTPVLRHVWRSRNAFLCDVFTHAAPETIFLETDNIPLRFGRRWRQRRFRGSTNEQYWRERQLQQLCACTWQQFTFFFATLCRVSNLNAWSRIGRIWLVSGAHGLLLGVATLVASPGVCYLSPLS